MYLGLINLQYIESLINLGKTSVKDVEKISKALSLTYDDINTIFFTDVVAWYATYKKRVFHRKQNTLNS